MGSGSASEETVPVSRFNGLMGKYQADKNAWERERAELLAAAKQSQETNSVTDVSALQSELAELKAVIASLAEPLVENSRSSHLAKVFEEYPEAKTFEDLLVGDDPEDIRETAKEIAERIRSLSTPASTSTETLAAETTTATEPAAPAAPVAPVTGGGSTFSGEAASQDQVADAIKNRDFSAWLRAKRSTPEWRGDQGLSA